jgi:hypothetical protein
MATYPTLSVNPSFPIVEEYEKAGLVSKSEYGYTHGRKKYTTARRSFGITYRLLPAADKDLLDAHIADVDVSTVFYWTHPKTLVQYDVRFMDIPKLTNIVSDYWDVSFVLSGVASGLEDTWGDDDTWGGDALTPTLVDIWGID